MGHRGASHDCLRVREDPLRLPRPSATADEPPSADLSELQSLPLLKITSRIARKNLK
jgi:hypothetical protein